MANAQSYRKYIEFGVLCLLASALLWWFGRNLDWVEVRRAVSDADPYLLVSCRPGHLIGLLFPGFSVGSVTETTRAQPGLLTSLQPPRSVSAPSF